MRQGPPIDRFLMRLKDLIIIGTALIALIQWLYLKPLQQEAELKTIEASLKEINVKLNMTPK